jgi:hypothetical protein
MTWTTGFALPKIFLLVRERHSESRCLGEDGLQSAALCRQPMITGRQNEISIQQVVG